MSRSARFVRLSAFSALAALALIPMGCGMDLEDEPLFKDQMKLVERMDEDAKALNRRLEDLNETLNQVHRQVREMRVAPAAAEEKLKSVETKLNAMLESLTASGIKLAGLPRPEEGNAPAEKTESGAGDKPAAAKPDQAKPDAAKKGPAAEPAAEAPAEVASAEPAPQEAPAAAEAASAAHDAAAKARVTRSSDANPREVAASAERPARLGFYYTPAPGETYQNVAARHGVSFESLRNANSWPKNRTPRPGQRVFVPAN